MTVPPASASTGCPGIETLAAFAEGRLDAGARQALVRHLADCDACREIVAGTFALRADLGAADAAAAGGPGAPLTFPSAKPSRPGLGIAAAAALVLVAGLAFLLTRAVRPSSSATLAAAAAHSRERAPLDQHWDEPLWSVMRGEGPYIADPARAFRLGVRSADLEFALHSEDREAAGRFAAEMKDLMSEVPLADPVVQVFRELQAGVEAVATDVSLERAQLGIGLAREALDPELFDLGRWAETGRLVTTTAAPQRLPRFPGTPTGADPELANLAADLEARAGGNAPAPELAEEFARLIARGGDLADPGSR